MASKDTTVALGIVVNPKLSKPLLVIGDQSDTYVRMYRLDTENWPIMGRGYYGEEEDEATRVTGFPRSHTPDGVKVKGMGYGTSLYTALCLGAHQHAEGRFKLGYLPDGDGIYSQEGTRSSEADEWWRSARRLGLAHRATDTYEDEDYDATDELSSVLRGETVGDAEVVSVNRIEVDLERTIEADAYPWTKASGHNLIVADFSIHMENRPPESLWRILHEDKEDEIEVTTETAWLLALDVRGLTLEAINLLGILAQISGADEKQLDGLRLRWEMGLDPSTEIRQELLPFKRNSADGRKADSALADAAALREQAGWESLADLP